MKEYIHVLRVSKLFYGLSDNDMLGMLDCLGAVKRSYGKGNSIFHVGEEVSAAALLLEGCVRIQREDYWGNLSILGEITPGEIFGEAYFVPGGGPMVNNAVAVEDSAVMFLNFNKVFTMCSSTCSFHTRLLENLFMLMAEKNRNLAQKLGHMSQRSTRSKLLSYLSEQSVRAGSPAFDIQFNRQQLADFLALDRSAMSNELCNMRDEGILEFKRNHFVLK